MSFGLRLIKLRNEVSNKSHIVNHQPNSFSEIILIEKKTLILKVCETVKVLYKINGFHGKEYIVKRINEMPELKSRIEEIRVHGGDLQFRSIKPDLFSLKLQLIDSLFPRILAELVKLSATQSLGKINQLIDLLESSNPIGYNTNTAHKLYVYKVKRFLYACISGMYRNQNYDMKSDFMILLENYDLQNSSIINPGGSIKYIEDALFLRCELEIVQDQFHDIGKIYLANDNLFYMDLNLQIRFT